VIAQEDMDIIVIGGGSAGICAAIAAARQGASVALIEKSDKLGGMGSLAMVHTFCGLYLPDTSRPPVVANAGLPAEIETAMRERTGLDGPVKMGRVYVLPQRPEAFDQLAKEMVRAESPQLTLLLQSECVGIVQKEGGGFTLMISSEGSQQSMSCRSLVDCSANAVAAQYLQATRVQAELPRLQRPSFIFSLQNVGKDAADESFRMRFALDIAHAVKAGELPQAAMGVSMRPSPRAGEVFFSIDLDGSEYAWDPSLAQSRKEISDSGQELAFQLCEFLKSSYPSFHQSSQVRFPDEIGVRESYRWLGKYILTSDDLISGREFDDAVAYATWPIELRETTRGARFQYFDQMAASQIPLRSLTSQEIPGVYFAGRCLSATHRALASVRVMGTCFATGQAAGIASALYAAGETDILEQAKKIRALTL